MHHLKFHKLLSQQESIKTLCYLKNTSRTSKHLHNSHRTGAPDFSLFQKTLVKWGFKNEKKFFRYNFLIIITRRLQKQWDRIVPQKTGTVPKIALTKMASISPWFYTEWSIVTQTLVGVAWSYCIMHRSYECSAVNVLHLNLKPVVIQTSESDLFTLLYSFH